MISMTERDLVRKFTKFKINGRNLYSRFERNTEIGLGEEEKKGKFGRRFLAKESGRKGIII